MLYTIKSSVAMKTINDEIVEKAKELGFGVLNEYPFKEMLKEKGHPIQQDIIVYELCNPAVAKEVLTKHPEVSVFLPCRISLYEEDGQVILSTMEIEAMLQNFALDDALKVHMNEVFNNLKKLLGSW